MRFEDVVDILRSIAAADSTAYGVVGALTLLVFLVMWAMLPIKSLTLLFAPVMFWSGLCGLYAATSLGFSISSDKAANVAGTSAIGMIVGLVAMTLLTHLVMSAARIRDRVAVAPPGRAARRG